MNGIPERSRPGRPEAPLARSLGSAHLLGTFPVDRDHGVSPEEHGAGPVAAGPETDDRAPDAVAEALADPRARILLLREGRAPARAPRPEEPDAALVLAWRPAEAWLAEDGAAHRGTTSSSAGAPEHLADRLALLGRDPDGAPLLLDHGAGARAADAETREAGDPWAADAASETGLRWLGLREAAAGLPAEDSTWFAVALALANWLDTSAYCPSCGSPAPVTGTGWSRRCAAEGREIFPRTDPAIIAAVVHTDNAGTERLLLGHSARWPARRWSTFAGFVEAGESLESAVAREIREESGAQIVAAEYLGSQPWPFPRSLMLGFRAEAASLDTRPDGVEITGVRWCTRAELKEAVESGQMLLPGPVSIAHHLIRDWYGEPLPVPAAPSEEEKTS